MNNKPKIPCSRCGSENTELRDSLSDRPLPIRLAERLLRQFRPGGGMLSGGRYTVVCRDCGHTACIQVL